jgi:hypothetical protein
MISFDYHFLFRRAKSIVESLTDRIAKEPSRYPRKIDAVLLNDAIKIICNDQLFNNHFKEPLSLAFPSSEVTKLFMERLIAPRNCLAHANSISLRQAEQVICYTGDIIESIKKYYKENNMAEEFNVPLILKLTDSFGKSYHRSQFDDYAGGGIFKNLSNYSIRQGDTLFFEVEIDPTFLEDEYEISWLIIKNNKEISNSPKAVITMTEKEVGMHLQIQCSVTTNKNWHRMGSGEDDILILMFKVLPPV